jgi:hypothetical protein
MRAPRRILVPLAILLGIGSVPGTAEAKCARASGTIAPATGKIPKKPVLRLLLPEWQANEYKGLPTLRARSKGAIVPITVRPDTIASGLRTYRLDVGATTAGALDVELLDSAGGIDGTWSYEIDPTWAAPTTSTAAITTSHEVSAWTCSHTRTTSLHFAANAWAYRVVAATSADLLAKGKTKSFVLPRATEQLWGWDPAKIAATSSVALGHVSCFGDTFDWTSTFVVADVFALQPDGSEQKVNVAPLVLPAP